MKDPALEAYLDAYEPTPMYRREEWRKTRCEVCGALPTRHGWHGDGRSAHHGSLSHSFMFPETPPRGHRADLIVTCAGPYCVANARRAIEERNGGKTFTPSDYRWYDCFLPRTCRDVDYEARVGHAIAGLKFDSFLRSLIA